MTTAADPSISSEPQPNATPAIAARVARVSLRLLLVTVMLLPVFGLLKLDGRLAGPLAILGLFSITLVRPEDGLLLCAAFLPIEGPPGTLLGFYVPLREPFVLAFLAGWLLRGTVRPEAPSDSTTRAILLPAWLLAAVVAASTLVQLAAYQPFEDFPWPYVGRVIAQLAGRYVIGDAYPGLAAGAMMLEGIGLFAAVVVLCRRHAGLTRRAIAMVALGGVAVAGLNLTHLAEVCVRNPGLFSTLIIHPRVARISAVFPDPNAAGSYLAMMLLVVAGLIAARRRSAWLWAAGGLMVLAALWFTGSRTGPVAVVVAGALVFFWNTRPSRRARFWLGTLATAAALTAVIVLGWISVPSTMQYNAHASVLERSEFSLAAIRAFRDGPIFGVGIGRFWSVSEGYIADPRVRALVPHENAHNNFLQILAELGCVGFVPFVWLLATVVRRALGARGDPVLEGLIGGVLAFLLTCLVGHPLLIAPVALGFWLVLGVTAARCGHVGEAAAGARQRWPRLVLAGATACLVLSIPIRASWFIHHDVDLHQAAIGFSSWQFDEQGIRYRTMKGRSEFYVPGSTCGIRLGLQLDPAGKTSVADVELSIDGQVANRLRVTAGSWTDLKVVLRPDPRTRFRRVDLRTPESADAVVMTGSPALAYCLANPSSPSSAVAVPH